MRNREDYIFFWGGYLSNFHPCVIKYGYNVFSSSEQLFMYLKAEFFDDSESMNKIINSTTPKEAKKLGRKVKGFDEQKWIDVRFGRMMIAVREKFKQNEDLRKQLLSNYANKLFVEASPYDMVWGIGVAKDDPELLTKVWGRNLLGIVLNNVCDELVYFNVKESDISE